MNDNDTTFTIERYQKLVVEAGTHRVETSCDDIRVRIICTDRAGIYPVVGLVAISGDESVYKFSPTGYDADFQLRIVPISPKSLGWVGVYRHENKYYSHVIHSTSESLLKLCRPDRKLIAIHEFFEGDGITQS